MSEEKITRARLRDMAVGETITVQCKDGYDLESQRNTAYKMAVLERCKFSCTTKDGLTLSVTKTHDLD